MWETWDCFNESNNDEIDYKQVELERNKYYEDRKEKFDQLFTVHLSVTFDKTKIDDYYLITYHVNLSESLFGFVSIPDLPLTKVDEFPFTIEKKVKELTKEKIFFIISNSSVILFEEVDLNDNKNLQ